MPRLTADQWETIRAEREAGASFGELASRHGISKPAIVKRSQAEGWGDGRDVGEAVRRKVTEKVTGIVTGANPQKVAAAIDATASRVAAVVEQHRMEWTEHRELFPTSHIKANFELGKAAKISAEMLKIRQDGERKAYGIESEAHKVELTVPAIDYRKLSEAALEEIASAAPSGD